MRILRIVVLFVLIAGCGSQRNPVSPSDEVAGKSATEDGNWEHHFDPLDHPAHEDYWDRHHFDPMDHPAWKD